MIFVAYILGFIAGFIAGKKVFVPQKLLSDVVKPGVAKIFTQKSKTQFIEPVSNKEKFDQATNISDILE